MEPVIVWVLVIKFIGGVLPPPNLEIEFLTNQQCEFARGGVRPNKFTTTTCEPKLQTIRRGG